MVKGGNKMSLFKQFYSWVDEMKPWLLMAAAALYFGMLIVYAKTGRVW